jgi:hypothetical protein
VDPDISHSKCCFAQQMLLRFLPAWDPSLAVRATNPKASCRRSAFSFGAVRRVRHRTSLQRLLQASGEVRRPRRPAGMRASPNLRRFLWERTRDRLTRDNHEPDRALYVLVVSRIGKSVGGKPRAQSRLRSCSN